MSITPDNSPQPERSLHKNELIKAGSNLLRGNILRDLADQSTGGITEESGQLTKFHGVYLQDDRDLRNQLRREGKEKAFIFMARVRVPGGVCTTAQWLALDGLADELRTARSSSPRGRRFSFTASSRATSGAPSTA
jgi:sulfite reductase (NADPH) hemoprotein beta-component